jgi:hypothetical protein
MPILTVLQIGNAPQQGTPGPRLPNKFNPSMFGQTKLGLLKGFDSLNDSLPPDLLKGFDSDPEEEVGGQSGSKNDK